jgi:hypothetical protein
MIDAKSLVLTHFSGKLEGSLYGTSVRPSPFPLPSLLQKLIQKSKFCASFQFHYLRVSENLL